MTQVRIGLIGCGPRAQELIPTFQSVPGCRITAVCDRIEALATKAAQKAGDDDVRLYSDHGRLLGEAAVDAVFICVAPEHNADLVCAALESGKHVLCEVPLALTIADCWRIVRAVEKSGLKFQMAEEIRHAAFIRGWRKLVAQGRLGKILLAEGQYFHGMTDDRYYLDPETGRRLPLDQAKNNPKAIKSRLWNLMHPILYLPHELSPLLYALDDRVVKVTCLATRNPGYHHEWFPQSDLEVALMHTAHDTILRLAVAFTVPSPFPVDQTFYHWYQLMGTRGRVETARSRSDSMKLWLPELNMTDYAPVSLSYYEHNSSHEARTSGHGGLDYYPVKTFVDAVMTGGEVEMDVYRAAESAAPAILAARSVDHDNRYFYVPDFRPNAQRPAGREPVEEPEGTEP